MKTLRALLAAYRRYRVWRLRRIVAVESAAVPTLDQSMLYYPTTESTADLFAYELIRRRLSLNMAKAELEFMGEKQEAPAFAETSCRPGIPNPKTERPGA